MFMSIDLTNYYCNYLIYICYTRVFNIHICNRNQNHKKKCLCKVLTFSPVSPVKPLSPVFPLGPGNPGGPVGPSLKNVVIFPFL